MSGYKQSNHTIMNENLNLVEILKDCPKGTKLYSTVLGEVNFMGIKENATYPIIVKINDENFESFTADGRMIVYIDGECTLFPSKEQRDWSKFKSKKPKFDPKTLKPFDKVLVRRGSENYDVWFPDFVSYPPDDTSNKTLCMCIQEDIVRVIPYNDDTKHLVGTAEEAPEYYRYWED